jgi:hypothetical protein
VSNWMQMGRWDRHAVSLALVPRAAFTSSLYSVV